MNMYEKIFFYFYLLKDMKHNYIKYVLLISNKYDRKSWFSHISAKGKCRNKFRRIPMKGRFSIIMAFDDGICTHTSILGFVN